ncbi:MAG: hypothetical protein V1846_04050 [Candidatus Komeilibacteria bacterium]
MAIKGRVDSNDWRGARVLLSIASVTLAVLSVIVTPLSIWAWQQMLTPVGIFFSCLTFIVGAAFLFFTIVLIKGYEFYWLQAQGEALYVTKRGVVMQDGKFHLLNVVGHDQHPVPVEGPVLRIKIGGRRDTTALLDNTGKLHQDMGLWEIRNRSWSDICLTINRKDQDKPCLAGIREPAFVVDYVTSFGILTDPYFLLRVAERALFNIWSAAQDAPGKRAPTGTKPLGHLAAKTLVTLASSDWTLRDRYPELSDRKSEKEEPVIPDELTREPAGFVA